MYHESSVASRLQFTTGCKPYVILMQRSTRKGYNESMKSYTVYANWNNGDEEQVAVQALNPVLARKAAGVILKDAAAPGWTIVDVELS